MNALKLSFDIDGEKFYRYIENVCLNRKSRGNMRFFLFLNFNFQT